jgi:hypothetical protein
MEPNAGDAEIGALSHYLYRNLRRGRDHDPVDRPGHVGKVGIAGDGETSTLKEGSGEDNPPFPLPGTGSRVKRGIRGSR